MHTTLLTYRPRLDRLGLPVPRQQGELAALRRQEQQVLLLVLRPQDPRRRHAAVQAGLEHLLSCC